MAEPRLAAEQHDALAERRVLVEVDPVVRPGESTIPWSATTTSRACAGMSVAELLGLGVDDRQLLEPLGRGDAVAVAGPVQVAVVEVGERRRRGGRGDGAGDPLADPVGVDPVAARDGRRG